MSLDNAARVVNLIPIGIRTKFIVAELLSPKVARARRSEISFDSYTFKDTESLYYKTFLLRNEERRLAIRYVAHVESSR